MRKKIRRIHTIRSSDIEADPKFHFGAWRGKVLTTLANKNRPSKKGREPSLCLILPSIINGPTIVVCHEKHGERYYLANDEYDLFKIAFFIVRNRLAENWYHEPKKEYLLLKEKPDFKVSDIVKMPKSIQADAKKRLAIYALHESQWQKDRDNFFAVKKAVETRDGYSCWLVLRDLSDGEYERVSLRPIESCDSNNM